VSLADGSGEKSAGKRTVRGRFFGSNLAKRPGFEAKKGFFRSFSEAKSHHVGYFRAEIFPQALISKGLKIICKDFREIYTPWGIGGGGTPVFSGQWSVVGNGPRVRSLFML
jgi:hypothetical protein